MNDDGNELENELRRFPLRPPSATLWRRLETELGAAGARPELTQPVVPLDRRRWWDPLLSVGLAAACLALLLWWPTAPVTSDPPPGAPHVAASPGLQPSAREESRAQFLPVAAENILFRSRDEGWVALANGTPARRVRQEYVDIYTWRDPHTNASLRWAVPREEVRVVPVSAY